MSGLLIQGLDFALPSMPLVPERWRRDLLFAAAPGLALFDYGRRLPLSVTGTAPVQSLARGVGRSTDGSASYVLASLPSAVTLPAFTLFSFVRSAGNAADTRQLGLGNSTTATPILQIGAGSGDATKVRMFQRGDGFSSPTSADSTAAAFDGLDHTIAITYDGSTVQIYIDGKPDISAAWTPPDPATIDRITIGAVTRTSTVQFWAGTTYLSAVWTSAMSARDVRVLSADPWQLFRPARRRIYVAVGGGTQFTATLTCSTTTSSVLARQANAIRAASTTATAALARAVQAVRSTSTTTTATAQRSTAKAFSASTTMSATLATLKAILQTLTASSTTSAVLSRQVQAVRTASSTLSATVARAVSVTLSAATTAAGSLVRQAQRAFSASVSVTAALLRTAGKLLPSSATLSATLDTLKQAGGITLTAATTVSATLARSIAKGLLAGLGVIGTLTLPGGSTTFSDVLGRMRRRLRR